MMTSVSAEEAHKPYVMCFSPVLFILTYGGKYGEQRERGNSRTSGKSWEH
ncbi:hypothetical protein CJF30_00009679 [Rutstroemia sp. NJR-2017a BBW]|nr:hypothetical protein CJF30_00009679 [Rutstroemia sp. NJR-2017a BBW]